jgi:hypothetical protein
MSGLYNVISQIDKDTNLYYKTPICIYAWIIINALNETEDAYISDFYLINKTSTFKLFFPVTNLVFSNIWGWAFQDHSTKVWLQLAHWFLRRRLKCEMLTDGRQTTDEK